MKYEINWTNMPIDIRLKIADHCRTLEKDKFFTLPILAEVLLKSGGAELIDGGMTGVKYLRFPSEAHYTWFLLRWS